MSVLAASLLLAAAAPSPGAAAPAPLGLGVMPARVALVGRAPATLSIRNPGSRRVTVAAAAAGVAFSARGRPRLSAARGASTWLRIRPRRLRIPPGGARTLTVAAALPRGAARGDHAAAVLLSALRSRGGVRVRLRVGVLVLVRVPGRVVHRLQPLGIIVRKRGRARVLEVRLANRGNVSESLVPGRAALVLLRSGRVVGRARVVGRELLPGSVGLLDFVYRGRLHGSVRARVQLPGPRVRRRVFRIRLP